MELIGFIFWGIGALALIVMLIWEITDILTAKQIKKMRIQDERRAQKKKDLERLIRDIAHQEIIRDSLLKMAFENALKGEK